jgi:hypothetical protein
VLLDDLGEVVGKQITLVVGEPEGELTIRRGPQGEAGVLDRRGAALEASRLDGVALRQAGKTPPRNQARSST